MIQDGKIEELTERVKEYANTYYELTKLEVAERTSVIGSGIFSGLLIGIAAILFLLFISLALGYYLSIRFGNPYLGFSIVSGIYLILILTLVLGRKKLIERPVRDIIIHGLFNKK